MVENVVIVIMSSPIVLLAYALGWFLWGELTD